MSRFNGFCARSSAVIALTLFAFNAAAQEPRNPWSPERPVTLIVPYAAGGSVDAIARALGRGISSTFGQPVVVENIGGADGLIGTRRAIDSKPDGYTLLVQVPSITIISHLPGSKGSVDPLTQLAAVTSIAESPVLMVGSSKIPAKDLKEFVAYCQASPKPCSAGSGESLGRLRAQQIAAEAQIPNMINVPYRGTTPAVTDLIGGNIEITFLNLPSALPHHRSGNVRILAVQDTKRSPQLPDVPTTTESGYPQFQMISWFGLFAPKATPDATLQAIVNGLAGIRGQADMQRAVEAAGATLVLNSPAEFAAQVQREAKTWTELVARYPLN